MGIWEYGVLWVYGEHGNKGIWVYGNKGIWVYGNMGYMGNMGIWE